MILSKNVQKIQSELHGQTIVAATKYVESDVIRQLVNLGITNIGENVAQALLKKQAELIDLPIIWHFLGHLQTNKVKMIINKIMYLHSLDSLHLAQEINRERTRTLDCFIEVNISNELTKTGISNVELTNFVTALAKYDKIRVVGLMGMAANTNDYTVIQQSFRKLAILRDGIEQMQLPYAPCHYLSMGMSHDYQIAIASGATHLRLGSILFRNEE
ncbi:MAG: YggS family pyridoxal phosphate-dependent enzyme [Candidatus Izemoplasmatales bacterium]|nr:YggS family pyridoxal phosphate-dependent enzyme [Candidatus Izemoplasmatales bacterium]